MFLWSMQYYFLMYPPDAGFEWSCDDLTGDWRWVDDTNDCKHKNNRLVSVDHVSEPKSN